MIFSYPSANFQKRMLLVRAAENTGKGPKAKTNKHEALEIVYTVRTASPKRPLQLAQEGAKYIRRFPAS